MRSLVSYDDIASAPPYRRPLTRETKQLHLVREGEPPCGNVHHQSGPKHRDEPGRAQPTQTGYRERNSMSSTSSKKRKRQEQDWSWQDRELTHEEIWDDSALIEAWDAAMEEYQAFNGENKGWKEQPIHQSALWYNQRPAQDIVDGDQEEEWYQEGDETMEDGDAENTEPIDFESFVPAHDPSLLVQGTGNGPALDKTSKQPTLPNLSAHNLANTTRDEAFQKAAQSWYWAGYWTAIYHSKGETERRGMQDLGEEASSSEVEEEADMLAVQRD